MKTLLLTASLAMLSAPALAQPTTRPVSFEHDGTTLVGTLYLPETPAAGPLPVVVVTGAWTTVQEQMPRTYALELAARGFAAFTFDFRGWGRSGDLPGGLRFVEDPAAKIADLRAALEAAAGLPEVDPGQVHGLGICASAGYLVHAAAGNARVRSVGLVAPWLQNAAIVEAVYGGPEGVAALRALAAEAARVPGGVVIPAAGPVGAEGVLMPLGGYYHDPARGAVPAYDNRWNQLGWAGWLGFHPADAAPQFDKPLAVVHSEAAAIPDGVRAFVAGLPAPAAVTWLDDVDQFSFYDRPDAVTAAADVVAAHFRSAALDVPAAPPAPSAPVGTTRLAPAGSPDTARVISVVTSIPLAVDLHAYDLAERAFAPEVVVDYTSLWGGEPQTLTPAALMDSWRGIVPGFDATWHELSGVSARVDGDAASATAFVDGRHWLDGQLWRPVGHYHWTLARIGGAWRVTRMAFAMTEEHGDRALAAQARQRAAARAR